VQKEDEEPKCSKEARKRPRSDITEFLRGVWKAGPIYGPGDGNAGEVEGVQGYFWNKKGLES
jgi:hypothetical protein